MTQEQNKIAEVLHDLGMDPQLIALMTGNEAEKTDLPKRSNA